MANISFDNLKRNAIEYKKAIGILVVIFHIKSIEIAGVRKAF